MLVFLCCCCTQTTHPVMNSVSRMCMYMCLCMCMCMFRLLRCISRNINLERERLHYCSVLTETHTHIHTHIHIHTSGARVGSSSSEGRVEKGVTFVVGQYRQFLHITLQRSSRVQRSVQVMYTYLPIHQVLMWSPDEFSRLDSA